eukprot:2902251-Lingulodinium_polyedra.AAC.1
MEAFVGDWPLEPRAVIVPRGRGAKFCAAAHPRSCGVQQAGVGRNHAVPGPPDAGCTSFPR